jgi:hypothetical protein
MSGTLDRTYSMGNVTGREVDTVVGGLVGHSTGTIVNSYNTANVTGRSGATGGLVGDNDGIIRTSYSSGKVTASASAGFGLGGLVGRGEAAGVIDSYWDVTASGLAVSAGGTGLQGAQMTHKANFKGFDFTTIWRIEEGRGTPQLR